MGTIVWLTGVSGAGRNSYANECREASVAAGRTCRVIDVGELLDQVPANLRVGLNSTELLDGNEDLLRLHRMIALNQLKQQLENTPEDLVIVSTHACFMRRGRMMSGWDMGFIKEHLAGKIDVLATIIHDCHDIWLELDSRPEWQGHLNLAEVAIWRDFETFLTKMLAEYEGKPFYLLARRDPATALTLLASPQPSPSIYLSYPITAIQATHPELLEEAGSLAETLREAGFVVFNPLSIKDVPGTRAAAGVAAQVPQEMEDTAKLYLDSQTISRDLQLIDQATMVVVYYPTDKVSPGVFTEMSHARDRRKPLFLCRFPGAPASVSPFLGLFYTEAFESTEGMVTELKDRYIQG